MELTQNIICLNMHMSKTKYVRIKLWSDVGSATERALLQLCW